jgi:hypothetical protein
MIAALLMSISILSVFYLTVLAKFSIDGFELRSRGKNTILALGLDFFIY